VNQSPTNFPLCTFIQMYFSLWLAKPTVGVGVGVAGRYALTAFI